MIVKNSYQLLEIANYHVVIPRNPGGLVPGNRTPPHTLKSMDAQVLYLK